MSTNAKELHGMLVVMFDELLRRSRNFEGLQMDTIFALGEALGVISKVKALVGRDIDDAKGGQDEGASGPTG